MPARMEKHKTEYVIVPTSELPMPVILRYWSDMDAYRPYFEDRWCDLRDPTIHDAVEHTMDDRTLTFFAFRPNQDLTPLGEFTLEPLGRYIFITHYSANPAVKMPLIEKFDVSIQFHRLAFNTIAGTMIGLTPVHNKKAIATALRFGYKRVDTLENAGFKNGVVTDAVLTVLTRNNFYSIYGDRP